MPSGVMPPLTSSVRPWGYLSLTFLAAALASAGGKLSSITTSAPAAAASRASSTRWHSTSILLEKPHAERALFTISGMEPPHAQTWLSLSIVMSLRLIRCGTPPPTMTAYFSTVRKPGVTFRVAATWPCQPWRCFTTTSAWVSVAMPLARESRFSAVRSPCSNRCMGPRTLATKCRPSKCAAVASKPAVRPVTRPVRSAVSALEPFVTICEGPTRSPSAARHSTEQPSSSNTASKKGTPASTPSVLARSAASAGRSPTTNAPTSKWGMSCLRKLRTSSL
mmetsp:Transcript_34959/g.108737  ORF Transcript_34959/g.108737 Transcript_34959/m.108737 type:complete len:279 (+) Transcript_34959:203-1039(+)